MVESQDQSLVLGSASELFAKLFLLLLADFSALRNVRIESDDAEPGPVQDPIRIGLGHRGPVRVSGVGGKDRRGRAKVFQKAVEAPRFRIPGIRVAVMVSGNRENGGRIMEIRLVELRIVFGGLSVVVDDVPDDVEEGRGRASVGSPEVLFHFVGNDSLGLGSFDASGVARGVEDQNPVFPDRFEGGLS